MCFPPAYMGLIGDGLTYTQCVHEGKAISLLLSLALMFAFVKKTKKKQHFSQKFHPLKEDKGLKLWTSVPSNPISLTRIKTGGFRVQHLLLSLSVFILPSLRELVSHMAEHPRGNSANTKIPSVAGRSPLKVYHQEIPMYFWVMGMWKKISISNSSDPADEDKGWKSHQSRRLIKMGQDNQN